MIKHIANIVTGCRIFGSVLLLLFPAFSWAFCITYVLCGVTDMFDGKVASTMKRNEAEKAFGIQIDSLCDLISFGVLPLAIGYGIGLSGGFFYAAKKPIYKLAALGVAGICALAISLKMWYISPIY